MQRLRSMRSSLSGGAIAMIDGKAKLIRDDYCDGLGNSSSGLSGGRHQL